MLGKIVGSVKRLTMNNWLANGFSTLNGVIAVVIVIAGAAAAIAVGGTVGVLLAAGAFIIAIMFCGPMAVLLDIRDQLIKMNRPR